jgi:hypothetical protein
VESQRIRDGQSKANEPDLRQCGGCEHFHQASSLGYRSGLCEYKASGTDILSHCRYGLPEDGGT